MNNETIRKLFEIAENLYTERKEHGSIAILTAIITRGKIEGEADGHKDRSKYTLNKAFIERAKMYRVLDRHNEAITDLTSAIELLNDDAFALYQRGYNHNIVGKYTEAIEDFTKTIALEPRDSEAYYHRGISFFLLKNYKSALEDYNKVIALGAYPPGIWYYRGEALSGLQRYKEAIAEYSRAITDGGMEHEWGITSFYAGRIEAYYQLQRYNEALTDANTWVGSHSNNSLAYYARGIILRALGRPRDAMDDFTKAINHEDSIFFEAYFHRALAMKEAGYIDWDRDKEYVIAKGYIPKERKTTYRSES